MSERAFWVGTCTGEAVNGAGIYRVTERADGILEEPRLAAEAVSPSYLAAHPGKDVLYAVREQDEGGVVAYDVSEGRLREIGTCAAGALPCHLSVTAGASGRRVIPA